MKLTRCTGHFTSGGSFQLFQRFKMEIMQVESKIHYCARYVSQKKFLELEGMLFDGALLLFSHQETASGV